MTKKLVLVTAALACGNPATPGDVPDINGSWNYSESFTAERGTVVCNVVGTLGFSQDFETFVGSYTRTVSCAGASKPSTTSQAGSIPRGRVGEASIEFRMADCDYRGTITKSPPNRITGTTLCSGTNLTTATVSNSAGSWLAQRISETAP